MKNKISENYSYEDYLRKFLNINNRIAEKQEENPYEIGSMMANKDISELRQVLLNIKTPSSQKV